MPITQDRMLTLITIINALLAREERLKAVFKAKLERNPDAQALLGAAVPPPDGEAYVLYRRVIYQLNDALHEDPVPSELIRRFYQEEAHFKANQKHNQRQKTRMRLQRHQRGENEALAAPYTIEELETLYEKTHSRAPNPNPAPEPHPEPHTPTTQYDDDEDQWEIETEPEAEIGDLLP